jgi:hypothetical protein
MYETLLALTFVRYHRRDLPLGRYDISFQTWTVHKYCHAQGPGPISMELLRGAEGTDISAADGGRSSWVRVPVKRR